MKLKVNATAGTLESSDVKVMIEPAQGISIQLESSVIAQYGQAIRKTIEEVLEKLEVTGANLVVVDKGALDCTIRARVQTAVLRSAEMTENLPWGTQL